MIDFRYHVVSLVAVFIALAVGIVLGAGPLREGISDTLEGEVEQLRAERADLRAELDGARSVAGDRDAALGTVSDRVVAATLAGARVAVVVLPAVDRNHLAQLEDDIRSAGGEVMLVVDVDPRLEALEAPEGRGDLARELRAGLEMDEAPIQGDEAAPDGAQPGLGPVLATALLGADAPGSVGAWLAALDRLEAEDYLDLDWRDGGGGSVLDRRPPDVLLVLDGPLERDTEDQPTRASLAALQERGALVSRLAGEQAAAVVAGAGAETLALTPGGGVTPLVELVRESRDLRADTSTVDNLETAAGRLATVLALAWELGGRSGSYGQAGGVDAPVPAPPPVRVPTPAGPPPDQVQVTEPAPAAPPTTGATSSPEGATATATP